MSDIKHKLKLIDKQLAGFNGIIEDSIFRLPLVFPCLGLIFGIFIQNIFNFSILVLSLLFSFIFFFLIALHFLKQHKRFYFLILFATLLSVLLGMVRYDHYFTLPSDHIKKLVKDERMLAAIQGEVVSSPRIQESDWKFGKFRPYDKSSSFYLEVSKVKSEKGLKKAAGKIKVYVNEPIYDIKKGNTIRFSCWLEEFKPASNPGQFDVKKYMQNKQIYLTASVSSREAIEKINKNSSSAEVLKRKIKKLVRYNYSSKKNEKGLIEALLLGSRTKISNKTYHAFKKTGLLHLISLSGLHVGILLGGIWALTRVLGIGKNLRAVSAFLLLWIFALIVPLRPATFRAVLIGSIFCLAVIFKKRSEPINTLCLAAIITLLINPADIFNAGWQLSFSCVLGIILFSDRIFYFSKDKLNFLKNMNFSFIKLTDFILRAFSVGFAAWIASLGIIIYNFNHINLFSPVFTVLTLPFISIILIGGYFNILLAYLLPTVSEFVSFFISFLAGVLIKFINLLAGLPFVSISVPQLSVFMILFYYIFVLYFSFGFRLKLPQLKFVNYAGGLILVFGFLFPQFESYLKKDLEVNVLDVSHGQCLVIKTPDNENIVFDCGSLFVPDSGARIAGPFMEQKGIDKINLLIAGHDDIDHINGIPELLETLKVREFYAGPAFKISKGFMSKYLFKIAKENEVTIKNKWQNIIEDEFKIELLWPHKNTDIDLENLSDNDLSCVLLLTYKNRSILICSDIERKIQKKILELTPHLKCDVIIAPHHGSTTTVEKNFLEKLKPDYVIASCSYHRFQKNGIVSDFKGTDVLTTACKGAISIKIKENGKIEVDTFKN